MANEKALHAAQILKQHVESVIRLGRQIENDDISRFMDIILEHLEEEE